MIIVKNTENLTGVCISGDYNDLAKLVEALYEITIDEYSKKYANYIDMSTRVLGLCYDLRHAFQGDREVELISNGMDEDTMKFHLIIAPRNNVYYKCNYLYPEMVFILLALNELIRLRISELIKSKNIAENLLDKNVIWDETIATIRSFQAGVVKCVKEVLSHASFVRWLKVMNGDSIKIQEIYGQYIDLHNVKYMNMTKEQRLKNFSMITKRIAEYRFDDKHREVKEVVANAAKKYNCSEADIDLADNDYPEDIKW